MASPRANYEFACNYMILRPEEANLCLLFRILCNRDIAKQASYIPDGHEENLQRRWLIFMSLSVQKALQHVAKPLKWFGSVSENWLNRLSNKVSVEETSPKFLSILGHMDKRMQLDNNIKPDDGSRYYAMLCAMASKLSYENANVVKTTVKECWKMEFMGFFNFYNEFQRKNTTQAFIFRDTTADPDVIVIAFRGTEPFDADAWCTDVDISWFEFEREGKGKVHGGFMKALGLVMTEGWPEEKDSPDRQDQLAYYTIRKILRENILEIPHSKTKFIVTGHSLGGALAILFPAVLALHKETFLLERLEGVYTFGQPRVGDEAFKSFMEKQMPKSFKYLRFVYCNDAIPRLPSDDSTFLFKHFGTCVYFNSCYKGELREEEPHKNWLPLATIPRILNASWELFRSFIIPYTKGPDYSESWLLKLVRFIGLAFPGLAAHNPQDYVNLTRLGSPKIYDNIQGQYFKNHSKPNQPAA